MLVFFILLLSPQTAAAIDIIGAIDGNVTIDAGGHYREKGAVVHAGRKDGALSKDQWLALSPAERARAGNATLNAQSTDLDVMRGEQKQEMNSRYKQAGITANLGGSLINAAQIAQKGLTHLGKSDNARVQAMAAANTAWNGYKAIQAVNEAVQSGSGSTLINLSLSVGSQHSTSHQKSREDTLQSSQLTGDSGVYLNIRGKGADSTLNVTGSDLGGIVVNLGSRRQNSDGTLDFKGYTPTLVGAIDGNVTISAGGPYNEKSAIIHIGRAGVLRIPRAPIPLFH